MFSTIITAETHFNKLLPADRLQHQASAELIAAARKWSDAVWAVAEKSGPMPLTIQQIEHGERLAQNPIFICGVHEAALPC